MAITYDPTRDLYLIIGVAETASLDEITKAYRKAIKVDHPDRPGGDTVRAAELNHARDVLSDPQERAVYDAARNQWRTALLTKWTRKRKPAVAAPKTSQAVQHVPTPIPLDVALKEFVDRVRAPKWKSGLWWLETALYAATVANEFVPKAKPGRPRSPAPRRAAARKPRPGRPRRRR